MELHKLNIVLTRFPRLAADGRIFPRFEFHILSQVRRKYDIRGTLFTSSGNAIFPDYHEVRLLAAKMNSRPGLKDHPGRTVRSGDLNAMGLIDEIFHHVLRLYEETENRGVFGKALAKLTGEFGDKKTGSMLAAFSELFPNAEIYEGSSDAHRFLEASNGGKPNKEVIVEEIILLHFANFNPAFSPFRELFDDKALSERSIYPRGISSLEKFFQTEKRFGPDNLHIFDLLRAPILASPDSLAGQLEYIKKRWGMILGGKFLDRILGAGDLMREDDKVIFHGGRPDTKVPRYEKEGLRGVELADLERFSNDLDWMPNVVLLAKNIYVWLDQLSRRYGRAIKTLSQIPDEELDRLARWNITALWLIGVWERSPASQKIKQWMGNPEAASSAYSLYDYVIADDLGGEEAYQNLRSRAWGRGIRMSGDMVPNHMGIFSKWVVEHPEFFIQSDRPPFPNYRFSGGNLSDHPDIEIRIEDGYWNRSDAAVVFQRIDRRNGEVRYFYHGNDGTHMPWNDTAQLNFMRGEVREAVIQTIFHVARKFPIIRFDAAMILTRQHFQRLWFPPHGKGGDIPSRSDHSMSTDEFNRLFPQEFWREVVDRVNAELPDTLLLAEAFWLLEGYFVRTLGMHRVYNSAFMNMLKMEENSKYRELIRNTMHYNPEILKRYVNFMSNPDEQTAVAQFGKDDKYFGTMAVMVTLPGLPMIGHGQIEGFAEKYGMEYRKAYHDEDPDPGLVRRHEAEIFPLLGKRYLFSQVSDFELYDFIDTSGHLNPDMIAYSNRSGNERAVVCFHNKYAESSGRIRMSVGRNTGSTDRPEIRQRTIGEALGCRYDPNVFYIFRDQRTNLAYIRSGKDLHDKGLYVELKAFGYHLFVDFREIYDDSGNYGRLASHLHGAGVRDLDDELEKVRLFPIIIKLYDLYDPKLVGKFSDFLSAPDEAAAETARKPIEAKFSLLAGQIKAVVAASLDTGLLSAEFRAATSAARDILTRKTGHPATPDLAVESRTLLMIYSSAIKRSINLGQDQALAGKIRFGASLAEIFSSYDLTPEQIEEMTSVISLPKRKDGEAWSSFFSAPEIAPIIGLNEFENVRYFNKEKFEFLVSSLSFTQSSKAAAPASGEGGASPPPGGILLESAAMAEYRFDDFIKIIKATEKEDRK